MKTLVTGGAGFIGRHLVRALVQQGIETVVVDDLSTGEADSLPAGATLHVADVRDVQGLWSVLKGVDVVFHLAARVSVSESILYPVEYNAVNTGGTVSLMTAARDAGVRRVVFTSSATVYGLEEKLPITEDAVPRPANPYAVSKLAAEGYVQSIGELYRIETVVLRIFNAYGPGQRVPSSHPPVIPLFVQRIMRGGSLVLHGSPPGAQSRDFVNVADVVDAVVSAGLGAGVAGGVFNIGSGKETALVDLIHILAQVSGRTPNVVAFPEHSGGVSRVCADTRRARQALQWVPRVALEDGLAELVASNGRGAGEPSHGPDQSSTTAPSPDTARSSFAVAVPGTGLGSPS